MCACVRMFTCMLDRLSVCLSACVYVFTCFMFVLLVSVLVGKYPSRIVAHPKDTLRCFALCQFQQPEHDTESKTKNKSCIMSEGNLSAISEFTIH